MVESGLLPHATELTQMLDRTRENLLADLDQAWALALAQENAMAMIEASWKKCLLLGLAPTRSSCASSYKGT